MEMAQYQIDEYYDMDMAKRIVQECLSDIENGVIEVNDSQLSDYSKLLTLTVSSSPLISAIIVNYNGRRFIGDCIRSIQAQTYSVSEIIVVDNSSVDGSVEYINEEFPGVEVVSLRENIGFAGANIEGLKRTTGEYILLLNNDAEAESACIAGLVYAMEAHPEVGICAPKILQYDQDVIESAGDGFSTNLRGHERGRGLSSDSYSKEEYVFGACAGAALYRRAMLQEIGFLDRDFFLIYEDTDFNIRAQLSGWKARYIPSAVVRHRVRSSIGHMSDTAILYSLRNCELARFKSIPLGIILRCLPSLLIGSSLELLYFAFKHRKPGLYLKAKLEAVKLLPKMLQKRKEIMRTRKVNNKYLYSIMTPVTDKEFFSIKLNKLINR